MRNRKLIRENTLAKIKQRNSRRPMPRLNDLLPRSGKICAQQSTICSFLTKDLCHVWCGACGACGAPGVPPWCLCRAPTFSTCSNKVWIHGEASAASTDVSCWSCCCFQVSQSSLGSAAHTQLCFQVLLPTVKKMSNETAVMTVIELQRSFQDLPTVPRTFPMFHMI